MLRRLGLGREVRPKFDDRLLAPLVSSDLPMAAHTFVEALPNGQLEDLDGQTDTILPVVVAPVLVAYVMG